MADVSYEALNKVAELLGVVGRASFNAIRQAYHDQIKKWHPDVSLQDPGVSHDMMIRVKDSHDLLAD